MQWHKCSSLDKGKCRSRRAREWRHESDEKEPIKVKDWRKQIKPRYKSKWCWTQKRFPNSRASGGLHGNENRTGSGEHARSENGESLENEVTVKKRMRERRTLEITTRKKLKMRNAMKIETKGMGRIRKREERWREIHLKRYTTMMKIMVLTEMRAKGGKKDWGKRGLAQKLELNAGLIFKQEMTLLLLW